MKLGKMYSYGNGLYFILHKIKPGGPGKKILYVSWWRTDDRTGKKIDMDLFQEMLLSDEDVKKYEQQ